MTLGTCGRVIICQITQGDTDRLRLAIAPERQFDLGVGCQRANATGQFACILDRIAIDRGDDITLLDAGLVTGRTRLRSHDERTLGFGEAERFGDILADRLDLHAKPAALDLTVLHQILNHILGNGCGDRESNTDVTAGR